MTIWIKIGTWPADVLPVVRKRKPPTVGETFYVRERGAIAPTRVYCDAIKDVAGTPLYFVSR
jgi:hypothetical protein